MLNTYRSAIMYGYSNARAKAMRSNLIDAETMKRMLATNDTSNMAGMLLQTEYKKEIEQFGGMKNISEVIDFALSENFGKDIAKLIKITPQKQRNIMRFIVGRLFINNIKLIIEAKANNKKYEDIAKYMIVSPYFSKETVKEALQLKTMDETINKLAINSPYSTIMFTALTKFKEKGNVLDTNAAIDLAYYKELRGNLKALGKLDKSAEKIVRMDIDMRNLILLIRGKRYGAKFQSIKEFIIDGGKINSQKPQELFDESQDLVSMLAKVKIFPLKESIELYKKSESKSLLIFEIAMRNSIFKEGIKLLSHSVLSFASILAYFYLKEVETFTVRILVKGKSYGLENQEIMEMVSWNK